MIVKRNPDSIPVMALLSWKLNQILMTARVQRFLSLVLRLLAGNASSFDILRQMRNSELLASMGTCMAEHSAGPGSLAFKSPNSAVAHFLTKGGLAI